MIADGNSNIPSGIFVTSCPFFSYLAARLYQPLLPSPSPSSPLSITTSGNFYCAVVSIFLRWAPLASSGLFAHVHARLTMLVFACLVDQTDQLAHLLMPVTKFRPISQLNSLTRAKSTWSDSARSLDNPFHRFSFILPIF